MKRIACIGCTGNIGKQTAQIVREHPERFAFSALACAKNAALLEAMQNEFHPEVCYLESVGSEAERSRLFDGCDIALIAASGFAGLKYTLQAIRAGKTVALANKESLVCGGEIVTAEAKKHGVEIVPVDSEHSAIFQALSFRRGTCFSELVLTASGGPFFGKSREELNRVTAADALKHPTWDMGAKVTIDSATLLNKGYEVIEAKWLYGADFSQIKAVVHPESIVHSLVYFKDGAALAQLAYPDMRLPIQLALTYPERLPCLKPLDLAAVGALHFYPLPEENFPCFSLALQAGRAGGILPAALNGAAEVAVKAFLLGRIGFPAIAQIIEGVLSDTVNGKADGFEALAEADGRARAAAEGKIHV